MRAWREAERLLELPRPFSERYRVGNSCALHLHCLNTRERAFARSLAR
jgi:hypothetical protein